MADQKPTSERLETLQARWESDKGSRLFLQLADEYRRLGREDDAVRVLDEGLQANPGHVGARVARGRSLLALGRAREATADLEKVIEADPTQMVAYRFLVEGYIQQRDADQARQRLRVYGLLNDADPDIEVLDRKIRELERAERTGAWPMPAAEVEESGATAKRPAPAVETERAAAETESAATETEEAAAAPPSSDSVTEAPDEPLATPVAPPPQRTTTTVDPFPALTVPEDRRRYMEAFDDDLFGTPATESSGDVGVEPAQPIVLEKPDEAQEPPSSPAPSDPFDLAPPPRAAEPDLGALLSGEEAVQEEPPAPPPPSPPPAPAEQGRATVTLGRLYLRQGHLEEAEESFREVLKREPDNAEAHRGLEEVAALRTPEFDVAELLDGYEPARHGEGLTARKRYAMRRYLERLRGGGADVH